MRNWYKSLVLKSRPAKQPRGTTPAEQFAIQYLWRKGRPVGASELAEAPGSPFAEKLFPRHAAIKVLRRLAEKGTIHRWQNNGIHSTYTLEMVEVLWPVEWDGG